MVFEPTILHNLAGCSNYRATEDSMVGIGEMWVFWLEPHPLDSWNDRPQVIALPRILI